MVVEAAIAGYYTTHDMDAASHENIHTAFQRKEWENDMLPEICWEDWDLPNAENTREIAHVILFSVK